MSIEIPQNNSEEVKNVEETEGAVEMSPEDFQEMLGQIPALEEMLSERKTKLSELERNPDKNADEINVLTVEIEELRQEIAERKELLEE